MDILAARKKAAEQAKNRQEQAPQAIAAPAAELPSLPVAQVEVPVLQPTGDQEQPVATDVPDTATVPPVVAEATSGTAVPGEGTPEPAAQQEIELLSFRAGGEAYAVLVEDVREVLKSRDITAVPNTPSYLLGVMSLRGTMLPVFDLCGRLGLAPALRDEKSRIIVVSPDEEDAGLLVDRVTGVLRIQTEAVRPVPENIAQGAEYLRGIVRKDEKLYILLDLEKTTAV